MKLLLLALLGVAKADMSATGGGGYGSGIGSGGYGAGHTGGYGGGGYNPLQQTTVHGAGYGSGVGSGYGNTATGYGNAGALGGGYGNLQGANIGGGYGVGAPHRGAIGAPPGVVGGIRRGRNGGCPNPNAYGYQANICGYGRYCVPQGYGRTCCPAPTCALQGYRVKQNTLPVEVLNAITTDGVLDEMKIQTLADTGASGAANDLISTAFRGTVGASLYPDDCCNICFRDHSCRALSYLYITDSSHKSTAVCLYIRGYGTGYGSGYGGSHFPDIYYLKHRFNQDTNNNIKFSCLTAEKVASSVPRSPHGGYGATQINGGYGYGK